MPDEEKQRSEAELLLQGLSKLEVPAALKERVLSRIRNAQEADAQRTQHGVLHHAMWVMTPLALLVLFLIALSWREKPPVLQQQARLIAVRNLCAKTGSSRTASAPGSATKSGKEMADLALRKPAESKKRLNLSGGWKVSPSQDEVRVQTADGLRVPSSGPSPENASGLITNAETVGTAIERTKDFAVPGVSLPEMRASGTPGEPLPPFETAAAPGRALPSFAETITNGDYQ